MEVRISRCSMRQLAQAADLFDQYRQFYGRPANLGGAIQFLRERLQRSDSVILLATDDADFPLGFTQLYPMFSSTRMVKLWVLNDLYVVPEARRSGVGTRLMKVACQHARRDGVAVMSLATQKNNTGAKKLYEAMGYKLDTEFDHFELTL